jgi:SulP family sulfate permease
MASRVRKVSLRLGHPVSKSISNGTMGVRSPASGNYTYLSGESVQQLEPNVSLVVDEPDGDIDRQHLLPRSIVPPIDQEFTGTSEGVSPNGNYIFSFGTHLVGSLPSVLLGVILNLLRCMSYGYIVFPIEYPQFLGMGSDGIAMFMISTIASQLAFTSFSAFKSGVGGMAIETIPFLNTMALDIAERMGARGPTQQDSFVPTVMITFLLSTVITAFGFFALSIFRLGNVMGFLPRHILVGSIGGVGYFLIATAVKVTGNVQLQWTRDGWFALFEGVAPYQWGSSLAVALILRLALYYKLESKALGTSEKLKGMFIPLFFIAIPVFFHCGVWLLGLSVENLREDGWLFDLPSETPPPFTYIRRLVWASVRWDLVYSQLPTILSLSFFAILNVPINVPALSVSTGVSVSLNRELANHGLANLVAAAAFSLPNYMSYSSSALFHRSGGGDSRISGYLLAFLTYVTWIHGGSIMHQTPTIVAGALMFHLGVGLLQEATIDTIGVVTRLEYVTIWIIIISMVSLGFTPGIGVGILLACVFFVATYSTKRNTAVLSKERSGTAWGTPVRRMPAQHRFLRRRAPLAVRVLELQGFLFFGTVHHIMKRVQDIVDPERHIQGPSYAVRKRRQRKLFWPCPLETSGGSTLISRVQSEYSLKWLILDFSHCVDMDFSAGEALLKLYRMLRMRSVFLVLSGVPADGTMARAFKRTGITYEPDIVQYGTLSDALEHCENELLLDFPPIYPVKGIASPDLAALAAMVLLPHADVELVDSAALFQETISYDGKILSLFQRRSLAKDTVLWRVGDPADFVCIVLKGALHEGPSVPNDDYQEEVEELWSAPAKILTYLPGTVIGVTDCFSWEPRHSCCWADSQDLSEELDRASCVVYMLERKHLNMISPGDALKLIQILIGAAR